MAERVIQLEIMLCDIFEALTKQNENIVSNDTCFTLAERVAFLDNAFADIAELRDTAVAATMELKGKVQSLNEAHGSCTSSSEGKDAASELARFDSTARFCAQGPPEADVMDAPSAPSAGCPAENSEELDSMSLYSSSQESSDISTLPRSAPNAPAPIPMHQLQLNLPLRLPVLELAPAPASAPAKGESLKRHRICTAQASAQRHRICTSSVDSSEFNSDMSTLPGTAIGAAPAASIPMHQVAQLRLPLRSPLSEPAPPLAPVKVPVSCVDAEQTPRYL